MPNGPLGCGLAWHGRLSYACIDGMAVIGINGGCDVRGCDSVLVRRLRCHRCLRVFSDVSSVNVAVVDVVDQCVIGVFDVIIFLRRLRCLRCRQCRDECHVVID